MSNNFDQVAFAYDRLARLIFGRSINLAQDCFLEEAPSSASVLILGGGSGRVLTELLSRKPKAKITYLEASQTMLDLTRERLKHWPEAQVNLIKGTEQYLSKGQYQFDVAITQFVLDVYEPTELQKAMALLDQSLKPSGKWIFADFCLSTPWCHRWWQWVLVKLMYWFFAITTNIKARSLGDFRDHFRTIGWKSKKSKKFYSGMIVAEILQKS
ncbi:MAG: class I SAM-dependent methyltransferase [Cyclobacteriaceae bacterium]